MYAAAGHVERVVSSGKSADSPSYTAVDRLAVEYCYTAVPVHVVVSVDGHSSKSITLAAVMYILVVWAVHYHCVSAG